MTDIKKTNKKVLDSWKEISSYLKRDIRTVQRWEKKIGLPVYRLGNSAKPRVFSYTDEIDSWLEETQRFTLKLKKIKVFLQSIFKRPYLILIITVFLLLIGILNKNVNSPSLKAVDFNILGSSLSILNELGKPLWNYDFNVKNLEHEGHYRQRFQKKRFIGEEGFLPCLILKDINNDGFQETIFAIQTSDNSIDNKIICFDEKGYVLWDFKIGRKEIIGEKIYSNDYKIIGFDIVNIDGNGTFEIIVLSNHREDFPGRITFFDSMGKQIGEYCNAGHLMTFSIADINQDKSNEILLGGKNEESGRPCCAILDYCCLSGNSPHVNNYYKFKNGRNNSGKYYILLPINAVRLICADHYNISNIFISQDPEKMIIFRGLIDYTLNFKLGLKEISFSHRFQIEFQKMNRSGIVTDDLKKLRKELYNEGALYYYEEANWSQTPTMVKVLQEE